MPPVRATLRARVRRSTGDSTRTGSPRYTMTRTDALASTAIRVLAPSWMPVGRSVVTARTRGRRGPTTREPAYHDRRAAGRRCSGSTGALSTTAMARMETDMPWFRELQRRGPVLGRADRPGRHPRLRRLVPRARRRRRAAAGRRGLRRRPAGPGRRDHPAADRRPGPALDRGGRGATSTTLLGARRRRPTCAPRCCATPARSPSPPPRSTPGPPRCAAPGTPGSRRWSSTPCCAPRPTRRCSSRASALGWAGRGDVAVVLGRGRRTRRTETDVFDEVRRAARAAGLGRALRASRATGWWSCSAGSATRRAAAERVAELLRRRARSWSARWSTTWPAPASRRRGRARRATGPRRGWPEAPRPVRSRRPAARARPGRRRPRPPAPGRGGLPAAGRRRRRAASRRCGVLRPRRLARGDRPGAVRAPQHRALPAAPGRRAHRLLPDRPARRVHAADRAGARPPAAPADDPAA